ncbi:DUF4345 family protein [Bacteroidota bacterium]
MAENKNPVLLKIALIIFAIVALVYGLCYFIIPDALVKLSGSEPVFHGWLRWSGGVLIALGVGTILVLRKPEKQDPFVITIAIGSLLSGLALVFAWITAEEEANIWFTALPAVLTLVMSALLWWGRYQARDILCPKQE